MDNACSVSIIVPIYNVEKYLYESLQSLKKQTFPVFEVIMFDVGSTDESSEIAIKIAEEDFRFKYIRRNNSGLSASRNVGLKYAKGKYILFMDSDDTLEIDAIDNLYHMAEKEQLELIVFGGVKDFYDVSENIVVNSEICGNTMDYKCKSGKELYNILRKNDSYFTGVPFQFVKKSVIVENQLSFYEGILHEDHLYTFQLIHSVKKCAAISNQYYHYRMRYGSITKGKRFLERTVGFACTFNEMVKWSEKKEGLIKEKEVKKHIDEIWRQTIKYIVFMSKDELKNVNLKEFIYMTQNIYNRFNIKHYWNIYFPFMRLLHYVYVLRENRWRQKHLK